MKRLIIMLSLCVGLGTQSQAQPSMPLPDSVYSLLNNPFVQIEATQAINDMYNFKFDRSLSHFKYIKRKYGWHPLPYFMMGLNYWWRIVPDFKNKSFDEKFYAYMDTALVLSERLYEEYDQVEGAFFLAATYAFTGRLYSERHDWTKSAFAGRNALKYLEECRGREDLSPELLFGDALFNYYAEWIPEEYPILKPIMMAFPDGDKELGMEQLKTVARNAFYTRTEAQYYLMRIAYYEEKDTRTALQVADYLHKTFPGNAYFHRFYTHLLYQTGRYNKAIEESLSILDRIDSAFTGYEYNSGRYASFFLGHIYSLQQKYELANKYLILAKEYAEAADATDMGYYKYTLLHLARNARKQEDDENAIKYYELVKDVSKRKDASFQEAKKALKELK